MRGRPSSVACSQSITPRRFWSSTSTLASVRSPWPGTNAQRRPSARSPSDFRKATYASSTAARDAGPKRNRSRSPAVIGTNARAGSIPPFQPICDPCLELAGLDLAATHEVCRTAPAEKGQKYVGHGAETTGPDRGRSVHACRACAGRDAAQRVQFGGGAGRHLGDHLRVGPTTEAVEDRPLGSLLCRDQHAAAGDDSTVRGRRATRRAGPSGRAGGPSPSDRRRRDRVTRARVRSAAFPG